MVSRHRLRHGQGQSLSVGQVERIGGPCPLASLVFHGFTATHGGCMVPIKIDTGKIEPVPVSLKYSRPALVKGSRKAPFPKMIVDPLPAQRLLGEQGRHGQILPLHARLHLVEHSVDNLRKWNPWGKAPFGKRYVWHDLHFYGIFVKYFVHGLWNLSVATQISVALYFDPNKSLNHFNIKSINRAKL